MKKHKFSEKLPEVGKEIFASIDSDLGVFEVCHFTSGHIFLHATSYFISGWDYSTKKVRLDRIKPDDWWADPEEEE